MCLFLFEIEVDDLGEITAVGPGKKSLALGVYPVSILAKEADRQMLVGPRRDSSTSAPQKRVVRNLRKSMVEDG